jgi:nucleoside diphosphate kinase
VIRLGAGVLAEPPEETTFVLVKPDAIARGMIGAIAGAWRVCGYRVVDVGSRVLTRRDVFGLSELAARLEAPIKHEFTAQYLTSAPVRLLAVAGPDAVAASGAIKNVFRQAHDADELYSLMHAPAERAELDRQRWLLDGPAPTGPGDRELTDAEVSRVHGLSTAELSRAVADTIADLTPGVRRRWTPPSLTTVPVPAGGHDRWGIVVADDTINSVDMVARALRAEVADLSPAQVVAAALRVKARTQDPVCVVPAVVAGRLWEAIGRHGLDSMIVPVIDEDARVSWSAAVAS